ncbi:MAG: hypothetical protein LBC87_09620 [Fibromonadaceae bacterium]|jgi:hypothetical protein|nr:hypothetical protein [Fibromonadaceae bacterium]
MQQYNIKKIKTITKAAKPIVKKQRIGFLEGKISVPADFDSMGKNEIFTNCR